MQFYKKKELFVAEEEVYVMNRKEEILKVELILKKLLKIGSKLHLLRKELQSLSRKLITIQKRDCAVDKKLQNIDFLYTSDYY